MQKLKSKDLRIGNYVMHNDELKTIAVINCDDTVRVKDTNGEITGCWYTTLIEPIELTEEWLLKVGAVKLDFKDFPSFNLFGMQINFINGLWIEYVSRVEVTGIHHLQNIFFFRNSEELTFKD